MEDGILIENGPGLFEILISGKPYWTESYFDGQCTQNVFFKMIGTDRVKVGTVFLRGNVSRTGTEMFCVFCCTDLKLRRKLVRGVLPNSDGLMHSRVIVDDEDRGTMMDLFRETQMS